MTNNRLNILLPVETIDGIAGSEIAHHVRSTERRAQPQEGAQSPTETLESICRSLALGHGDRHLRHPIPTEFYNDFLNLCLLFMTGNSHVNKDLRDWFRSTTSLRFNERSFVAVLRNVQNESTAAPTSLYANQNEYIRNSFCGRFFDISVKMSLCVISSFKIRVRIVPEKTRVGDSICILHGCGVPMELRQCEGQDQFTTIGEYDLNEIMNGEALEHADASEVISQIN